MPMRDAAPLEPLPNPYPWATGLEVEVQVLVWPICLVVSRNG